MWVTIPSGPVEVLVSAVSAVGAAETVGNPVGMCDVVGLWLGTPEGILETVGDADGCSDGFADGADERVGVALGARDGVAEGIMEIVGEELGAIETVGMAEIVGAAEGDSLFFVFLDDLCFCRITSWSPLLPTNSRRFSRDCMSLSASNIRCL